MEGQKSFRSLIKPSEKIEEYRTKYMDVLKDHAEFDGGRVVLYENEFGVGEKLTNGNGFPNIIKDVAKYNKLKEDLDAEYSEELKNHDSKIEEFNKTLDEECDVELIKFDPDLLPELDYDTIKALKPLLKQ